MSILYLILAFTIGAFFGIMLMAVVSYKGAK